MLSSSSLSTHILVHYHRLHDDYHGHHLAIFPSSTSTTDSASSSSSTSSSPQLSPIIFHQARSNALSSFGAIYRIDLSLFASNYAALPTHLNLLPIHRVLTYPDHPPRILRLADLHLSASKKNPNSNSTCVVHVFIAQACSDLHFSPSSFYLPTRSVLNTPRDSSKTPRFLFFLLNDDTRTSVPNHSLLHLHVKFEHNSVSKDNSQLLSTSFHHLTLFPATSLCSSVHLPVLFILDTLSLPQQHNLAVFFTLVLHPTQFNPSPPCPLPDHAAPLILPCSSQIFNISLENDVQNTTCLSAGVQASTELDPNNFVAGLIHSQSLINPALSRHIVPKSASQLLLQTQPSNSSDSSASIPSVSPFFENKLIVYYHHGHGNSSCTSLAKESTDTTTSPVDKAAVANSSFQNPIIFVTSNHPSISNPVIRNLPVQKENSSVSRYEIDLTMMSSQSQNLTISFKLTTVPPPSEPMKANDTSSSPSSTSQRKFQWTPQNGYHVIITPTFPRLLTPSEANIRLYYHRFDAFADWHLWRLRLTCSKIENDDRNDDENSNITKIIRANRPHRDGVSLFNVDITSFPYHSNIRVEMFRIASAIPPYAEGDQAVNGSVSTAASCSVSGSDHIDVTEGITNTDRCDVVREWKNGSINPEIHFVQGDVNVHSHPPERSGIERRRKIRVRYRRFLPKDYEGWDLWTWDDADSPQHRVPIAGVVNITNSAWMDFIIDLAQYGSAQNISVLPRKDGDKWTEKDYPVRVINVNEVVSFETRDIDKVDENDEEKNKHVIKTVIITQGEQTVFRNINEDVKGMLDAFVSTKSSIIIRTPVPIAWVSPPKQGRPKAVADTRIQLHDKNSDMQRIANKLHNGDSKLKIKGKDLRFTKLQEVSPVEIRLKFNSDEFDEDFPVENVVVTVPGFDSCLLHWETKPNWDDYLYEGTLGWEYERSKCRFRCFAPTADKVSLILYKKPEGNDGRKVMPMRKVPEGCWKIIVHENVKGRYYKLLAEGENKRLFPGVEVIDPYSKCNTAHTGRGYIYGIEQTKITPRPKIKPNEAIVYELHIRDITIDEKSGISNRGKFDGLCEHGTKLTINPDQEDKLNDNSNQQDILHGVDASFQKLDKLSTGLDHIAQMGVNTIQILPIQDFDNDEHDSKSYRWGYMPVHFNSPDGWYASRTDDVSRVTEFKKLVDTIHKAGMKVIMDVVYNHTAEDSNEFNLGARFSFNGLAPRYYYRTCGNTPVAHTGDSTCGRRRADEPRCGECYSNGSGCGNEFRSEGPMGRKFIIDSLKMWVTEYQVDGFRFDLMGLIDIDTMTAIASELHAIDENIMVYGEPWAGGLSPIQLTEKGMQRSKGFGVFNNTFRDAIRGSPFESEETFVMDGGRLNEIKGGIIGSIDVFSDEPVESMNYVECHDNYTLWDHFRFYVRSRMDNIEFSQDDLRRMHRLAAVLVFTSQGVAFIQAGQEMCRTKFDVENSYESPDEINMIRWENKLTEWTTVQYYRGLTILRRSHPEIFCKEAAKDIHESVIFYEDLGLTVPTRCIAYRIKGNPAALLERLKQNGQRMSADKLREESMKWTEVVVLLNPTPSQVMFQLPEAENNCIWLQVVDASQAGVRVIRGPAIGCVFVEGRSAAILRRASEQDAHNAQLSIRLDTVTDSYCSFHGDDALNEYAVGLHQFPSPQEAIEQKRLRDLRQVFEKQQASNKSKNKISR